ncbi:hypothetical protein QR680_017657 [Steinernema hermaphroditum]|uniref:FAD-dependent oxidoreductase domain-containing protein 1 n=1 Tax=Steinernema hermaphroditum TaxID=289476 RepID=A0AA39LPF4_9BILA|nr:hypothetical protein QR680_017657 [Steinernema hermaphroditum]
MERIRAPLVRLAVQKRLLHTTNVLGWQKYENERHFEPGEDVPKRVWHGLTYDFRRWKRRFNEAKYDAFRRRNPIAHAKRGVHDYELLPYQSEVVIIGGGLTGSATAFWIKQRFRDEDFRVTVVENTDHFADTSTMLSTGAISQQFSVPEHIEMSLFTAEFLRHAGEHLRILDNDPPDINVLPLGFMHLARNDREAEKLRESWKLQIEKGARVAYLTQSELMEKFPFMNFEGIQTGTYGLENEGVIDAWQLLAAIREKNITLGVNYVKGEVEGFHFERSREASEVHGFYDDEEADDVKLIKQRLWGVIVRPQMAGASARPIRCHMVVNAAGPWSGKIAELAGIGKGKGTLSVPIPIVPRKRMAFIVNAPDVPAIDMPALVDPSGVYCRPDSVGHNFVCGKHPTKEEDAAIDHSNLDVDYDYFYDKIWPVLVERVPSFKNLKIVNAWAGYEDVNTFDDSPVIGEHLLYNNFHTMSGFGNFGIQHSISVGRAFAERIFDGAYTSINLRKFDMRRIMAGSKIEEPLSRFAALGGP